VVLKPTAGSGSRIEVEADHIVLLTGYVQDPDLYEQLGVELMGDSRKPKFSLDTMETNVPGVFVVGTGSAGTQLRAKVFIETSHVHAHRVVAALEGRRFEGTTPVFELEEN
jgi:thioredoxin reductase (NADPH)